MITTDHDQDIEHEVVDDGETLSIHIEKEVSSPGCYLKCRHVLAVMLFFATFNLFSLRVNLNVAIVAMVNSTADSNTTNHTSDSCPDRGASNIDNTESNGVFTWDRNQQGLILGCYYYGYLITGLPGGYLAGRYGVKPVLGLSMLISSILTILTPIIAYTSFNLFVASRVAIGFFQGICLPAVHATWGRWAPPPERMFLISSSYSGTSFGIFATLLMAGVIAENLGWEAVFYVTGGGGLLWTCIWFGIIHSWPEKHPRISTQERSYIIESIGVERKQSNRRKTPWFRIFTSIPVWAITITLFCNLWGSYTLLTMLPTYMATILRFSLTQSGGLSAMPYILSFCISLGSGYISDVIRRRGILSTLAVRKVNATLAAMCPAILLVLAAYVGCNVQAAVAFFSLATAFTSFSVSGAESNPVDLSPEYSGIIYGLSNTLSNIPGFLATQLIGVMLQNDASLNQWRNVFWVTAGVYTFGIVCYLIFASAKEQPWASDGENRRNQTNYSEIMETKGVARDFIDRSATDG